MKKIVHIILKVIFCLIMAMPILGATGVFPPPTPDLYNTSEAFAFIESLTTAWYITYMMAAVFTLCIALIIMGRTALAAILALPITLNVVAFHLFLDGGLLTAGASLGNLLLLINLYFIWANRAQYMRLLDKSAV